MGFRERVVRSSLEMMGFSGGGLTGGFFIERIFVSNICDDSVEYLKDFGKKC